MPILKELNSENLKKFQVIYCDSYEEYKNLLDKGLTETQIIKTSSPTLLNLNKKNIFDYKIDLNSTIININWEDENFYLDLFNLLKQKKIIDNVFVHIICRELYIYHRIISCIYNFNEKNLKKNTLFIQLNNYQNKYNSINFDWFLYFKDIKNFYFYQSLTEYDYVNKFNLRSFKNYFWKRVKNSNINSILSRLIIKFNKYIPNIFFNKRIYFFKENNTFLDAVPSLFFFGYQFIQIPKFKIKNQKNYELNSEIKKIIEDRIKFKLNNEISKILERIIINHFITYLERYISEVNEIKKFYLNDLSINNRKKNIIFSNYSLNKVGYALYNFSQIKKIPFVTFQHGIGNEILHKGKYRRMLEEAAVSDIHFVYSKFSKKYYESSKFINCKMFISGMPRKNYVNYNKNFKINSKKILFVSTKLYAGYINCFPWMISDYTNFLIEKNLLTNIFSKINSKIYYKQYPIETLRYVDADPIYDVIKDVKKIKLIDSNIDVRFLINEYNILITNRFSATTTWLMLTNKPLIYINHNNIESIRDDLKESFKKSLFYFDYDNANLSEDLASLLNTSIIDIMNQWKSKEKYRNKFILNYLNSNSKSIFKNIINNIKK